MLGSEKEGETAWEALEGKGMISNWAREGEGSGIAILGA